MDKIRGLVSNFASTDPLATLILLTIFLIFLSAILLFLRRPNWKETEARLAEVAKKAENHPESFNAQWKLYYEEYKLFAEMNVRQNWWIFSATLCMLLIGFVLVVIGFFRDYYYTQLSYSTTPTSIPVISTSSLAIIIAGALSTFFAGSILIIFRSVFQQTAAHRDALEKFASFGIAMTMLDTVLVGDEAENLKNKTAANLAKLLIIYPKTANKTDIIETETKIAT